MFGHRYFGARYYGPRYFGPALAGGIIIDPEDPPVVGTFRTQAAPGRLHIGRARTRLSIGRGRAFSSMGTNERVLFSFEFDDRLGDAEVITSATWTASVKKGVDANPVNLLKSAEVILGTQVSMLIGDPIVGNTYTFDCAATTDEGELIELQDSVKALERPSSGHVFHTLRANEREWFTFDFVDLLLPNDSIVSATWEVSVKKGEHATPNDVKEGAQVINGTQVWQRIDDGIVGNTYRFDCLAFTTDGERLQISDYVKIKA